MLKKSKAVLSQAEKCNLLIQAMEADGLNCKLKAGGVLDEQAIVAANRFISRFARLVPKPPPCELTNAFLAEFVADTDLRKARQYPYHFADEAIRIFFDQNGITL